MCAVTDFNAAPVGGAFTITGTAADAMVLGSNGLVSGQALWADIMPGTIDMVTDASSTGQYKLTIHYTAIDSGATITTA